MHQVKAGKNLHKMAYLYVGDVDRKVTKHMDALLD